MLKVCPKVSKAFRYSLARMHQIAEMPRLAFFVRAEALFDAAFQAHITPYQRDTWREIAGVLLFCQSWLFPIKFKAHLVSTKPLLQELEPKTKTIGKSWEIFQIQSWHAIN